jgi:hypothetical protein
MARGLAVAVLAVLLLVVAAPAQAASGTYTCANLQTGLNQVQDGDVITVDGMCNDGYTLPSFPDPSSGTFKSWTLQGSGGDDGFDGSGLAGERVLTGNDVHRLVIQDLTVRDSSFIGPGADGGAIDITGQSGLQLFNNKFFNNHASDLGGAVHLAQDTPPSGFNNLGFSAFGNVFGSPTDASEGNTALIGGAVSVESPGTNHQFSLTENTFANNVAEWNGGAFSYELAPGGGANVGLNGNDVLDNTAGGAGGGGWVMGPVGAAQIDNELYQGNSLEEGANSPQGDHLGGGLFLQAGVPILRHNTFDSNSIGSFNSGDLGGGGLAVVAPGVFGSSEFTRIVNNTVAGQPDADWESEGGGLFISGIGFWTSFLDSIAGNTVGALGEGGGVYTGGAVPTGTALRLVESTVAGNTVGAGGHFAGISGDANDHLVARNSIVWNGGAGDIGGFADFDLKYSDACKNSGGAFDGEGNICTNPLLVNPSPGNADIHQTTASPTIDAGSDELLSEAGGERPDTDYEGDPRPTDGDGDGHTVDMGADESPAFVAGPPPPPHTPQCSDGADNDGDGAIDAADPGCLAGPADDNEGDETPGDLVLCGQRTISLVRADVKGSKVELSGFVATSLAGQKVKLSVRYLGKGGRPAQLGSVRAAGDGSFKGRVPKPSRKLFNVARYRAQIGTAKSVELKLPQSLESTSLKRSGSTLVLTGKVDRAVVGKRNAVVVKRILCGKYATVGQAKPDAKGRYVVRFPSPASGGSALYRAETKVLARPGSKRYVKQFARAIGITF